MTSFISRFDRHADLNDVTQAIRAKKKVRLDMIFRQGIRILALSLLAPSALGDVTVGCISETLSAELSKMASVSDIAAGSPSVHLIIELPIRFANLELKGIHLRRFEDGKRVLWVGIPFDELDKNRSWSTAEIRRSDLDDYEMFAQYHTVEAAKDECFYEFPVELELDK